MFGVTRLSNGTQCENVLLLNKLRWRGGGGKEGGEGGGGREGGEGREGEGGREGRGREEGEGEGEGGGRGGEGREGGEGEGGREGRGRGGGEGRGREGRVEGGESVMLISSFAWGHPVTSDTQRNHNREGKRQVIILLVCLPVP